ncbi:Dephospho-CoA kinase [Candidatus Hepatincola sp. Av]
MIIIGITGNIGSGKTTVSNFLKKSMYVFNSDDYVKELSKSKKIINIILQQFPKAKSSNGGLDIPKLREIIFSNYRVNIKTLEDIYHPYVLKKINSIIFFNKLFRKKFIALEVPLLFETGLNKVCHKIIVTICSAETQKARVLAREGMNERMLTEIMKKQGNIKYKMKLANYIINTDEDLATIENNVNKIIESLS